MGIKRAATLVYFFGFFKSLFWSLDKKHNIAISEFVVVRIGSKDTIFASFVFRTKDNAAIYTKYLPSLGDKTHKREAARSLRKWSEFFKVIVIVILPPKEGEYEDKK